VPLAMALTWYRDLAVRALGPADVALHNADLLDERAAIPVDRAVRHADAITSALARLRRQNPNRQLLLEALFLQLRDAR